MQLITYVFTHSSENVCDLEVDSSPCRSGKKIIRKHLDFFKHYRHIRKV